MKTTLIEGAKQSFISILMQEHRGTLSIDEAEGMIRQTFSDLRELISAADMDELQYWLYHGLRDNLELEDLDEERANERESRESKE